jgi:hypothetical protein
MRTGYALITLVAIALLAPPAAAAESGVPHSLPKDYSRNSVTGEHLPDLRYRMGTSSLAGTTSAAFATVREPARPDGGGSGDPWTELVVGLAGACVGAGGTALAGRTRRTRHASVAA